MLHCSLLLRKGIKTGIKISEDHPLGCAAQVTGAGHSLWKPWKSPGVPPAPAQPRNCRRERKALWTSSCQGLGAAQAGQELWREGGREAASPGWKSTSCQDSQAPEQKAMKEERPLALGAVREGLEVLWSQTSNQLSHVCPQVLLPLASGGRNWHQLLPFQPFISFRRGEMET